MPPLDAWSPVFLSLQVALTATLCSLPPAILVARLLSKRRFRFRLIVEIAVTAPLVLPPIVTGYFLLLLLGRGGPVGAWLHGTFGLRIAFTWVGAAIAAAIISFPLLVKTIQVGFEAMDKRLGGAARTLGATRADAFLSVTLPLAAPGIVAGCMLCFARCLGEFGATIVLAGNIPGKTQTIPLAIYNAINVPGGEGRAFWLLLVSVALSIGSLVISQLLSVRGRAEQ